MIVNDDEEVVNHYFNGEFFCLFGGFTGMGGDALGVSLGASSTKHFPPNLTDLPNCTDRQQERTPENSPRTFMIVNFMIHMIESSERSGERRSSETLKINI